MPDSLSQKKDAEREIIAQQIRIYLSRGGKIQILKSQEFSNTKQFDWSGKELKKREREKYELSKKV
jgi:hypothetical protein|tara:strand:+ start:759 stop:956 length:198 start_codon:yes stop_codon:yes gene_type:complete